MNPYDHEVSVLAGTFIATLCKAMTDEQYLEFLKKTREEYNADTCHSHDYVDANECMLDAFELAFDRKAEVESDADMELMNTAWTRAKNFVAGRD